MTKRRAKRNDATNYWASSDAGRMKARALAPARDMSAPDANADRPSAAAMTHEQLQADARQRQAELSDWLRAQFGVKP